MHLQRKILRKWALVIAVCGGHSFFWGSQIGASPWAMALGMLTLMLAFVLVESQPFYQARRLAAPRLGRALDWGVKCRVYLAIYILLLGAYGALSSMRIAGLASVLFFPYIAELYLGMVAVDINVSLTGLRFEGLRSPSESRLSDISALTEGERFLASYSTTIITGLLHTLILALLCLLAYGVICLRSPRRAEN